jgi:hypothetical protein
MISNGVKQKIKKYRDDFEFYAPSALKIRTKSGKIEPFELNKAQRYIHERLEKQLSEQGYIRAIILKGRQQGCSTYIGGRFYWKVQFRKGVRAFILTHEQEATNNLFDMTDRYHEHNKAALKPSTGASNAKELHFDKLDSGYKVGTAGTKGVGRSQTIQYFHGSEVAFWPHAETHAAGVMQAIPNEPGTEIILESTANGMGNYYHQKWQEAEAGEGDYIAIFVPWYWQDEYSKPCGDDFEITPEEQRYASVYGCNWDQIKWRRDKISELGSEWLFKQEYPATATEAFQVSGEDTLIDAETVMHARKTAAEGHGPIILGVDPARYGDDRTSIVFRQGRKAWGLEYHAKKSTMEVVGIIKGLLDNNKIAKAFVDVGGLGAGILDRLDEMGYDEKVKGINFGSIPLNEAKYSNKRAEMWGEMRDWLQDTRGVQIPDDDALHADLCSLQYTFDSSTRLKLESKEQARKRGVKSPDGGDALALTFAEPVADYTEEEYFPQMGGGAWMG